MLYISTSLLWPIASRIPVDVAARNNKCGFYLLPFAACKSIYLPMSCTLLHFWFVFIVFRGQTCFHVRLLELHSCPSRVNIYLIIYSNVIIQVCKNKVLIISYCRSPEPVCPCWADLMFTFRILSFYLIALLHFLKLQNCSFVAT